MSLTKLRKSFIESCNNLNEKAIEVLIKEKGEFGVLSRNLHAFIHERIDSLFVLVQAKCLWDADIILRSIAEASIKLIYVSSFSEKERNEKSSEFWNELAEINQLKQSKQAKTVIEYLKNSDFDATFISPIVLDEDEQKLLEDKWTKKERQKILQPWSFNEMVKTLATKKSEEKILCLARVFTQSSHLTHADETALGVINDRKNRTAEEKEISEILHEVRLLSDCVSLYSWSLLTILNLNEDNENKIINELTGNFFKAKESFKEMNAALAK